MIGETLLFEELTKDLQPAPGTRYLQILTVTLHSALFRRDVFDRLGLFDETLSFSEDFDFFLRLAEAEAPLVIESGSCVFVSAPSRQHDHGHGCGEGRHACRFAKVARPKAEHWPHRAVQSFLYPTPGGGEHLCRRPRAWSRRRDF